VPDHQAGGCGSARRGVTRIGIRIVLLSDITITDVRSAGELERWFPLAELEPAALKPGSLVGRGRVVVRLVDHRPAAGCRAGDGAVPAGVCESVEARIVE
jgi:hypothetical protein